MTGNTAAIVARAAVGALLTEAEALALSDFDDLEPLLAAARASKGMG